MNSYDLNYTNQNLYPNYIPGLTTNPIQFPNTINDSSGKTPQNCLPRIIETNSDVLGYNPVKMIPSQINSIHQILISNQNMLQGKCNQVIPLYESNINTKNLNQNMMKSENNFDQNKVINELTIKNSILQSKRENEILNGHPSIPMKLAKKAEKSICKITYNYDNKEKFGTGFFMKFSNSLKLLITNYHILNPKLMNIKIQIELCNNEKMILNFMRRYIKFMEIQDITAIEIKETDKIYKYIQFLNYDSNYNQCGYDIYKNSFVFSIEHPLGNDAACASGSIIKIYNNFEFDHDIYTDYGSSGCPIILLNDLMMVIGIHKNSDKRLKINGGSFIGELINEINKEFFLRKNESYIIDEIYIKNDDINKNKNIINLYEEVMRNNKYMKFEEQLKNEKSIKEMNLDKNKEKINKENNINTVNESIMNIKDQKNIKIDITKEINKNDNNENEKLTNNNNEIKNDNKNNNTPHFIKSIELRLPPNLEDISYDKPKSG